MNLAQAHALVVSMAFDRVDIDTILNASAGVDASSQTVFRPYVTAAFLWMTSKNTQRVHSAKGTQFETTRKAVQELCTMQAPFDADLTIPPAWTCAALLAKVTPVQVRVFSIPVRTTL